MYESIRKNSLFSVNQLLRQIACLAILFMLFTLPVDAVEEDASSGLKELLLKDIDELGDIIVQEYISLASKRPEKVWETPAAAYVITATDISRSAATNIPDLLRMVPGLFVGNADSSTWIVGTRGLANEYAVDLLVLIDGRQVNNYIWGGIFWNVQDYPLEDIERIEIIRGPGGTLWGTNSGNGVINIITKHARDTQGGLLSGIVGTDLYKGTFRYGGKMGDDAFYRLYGTYKDVDSFNDVDGSHSVDDWSLAKAGFRIDWQFSQQDELTFQGDAFQDDVWFNWHTPNYLPSELYPVKERYEKDKKGFDLQVQWDHTFEDGSKMKWLSYYDYFSLENDFLAYWKYQTLKTDFQYQFDPFPNHEFIVGSGYRLVSDEVEPDLWCEFEPPSANDQTFTAFIQDNYTIIEEKLNLSLGTQLQYSDYSGFDYQPSVKLTYTPTKMYTLWAAITRSAQHYYRGENEESYTNLADYFPGSNIPMLMRLSYEGHAGSENILSFEIGQRLQANKNLSIELNTFYNMIKDNMTVDPDFEHPILFNDPIIHYIVDSYVGNNIDGETYGAELALNTQITDSWKLMASYSALDIQLHRKHNSMDIFSYSLEDASPHHQFKINSYFDLTKDIQFDASYYWIDEINNWRIPTHGRLDLRLGWKPTDKLEVSVVGKNLLNDQTHEATGIYTKYTEAERGVYGKLTYRF